MRRFLWSDAMDAMASMPDSLISTSPISFAVQQVHRPMLVTVLVLVMVMVLVQWISNTPLTHHRHYHPPVLWSCWHNKRSSRCGRK